MILEVYDLECLSNLFTYTGYIPKEDKYYQFVICNWRNDIELLMSHLKRDILLQVGYNNISFDYPLEHHLINHFEEYRYLNGMEIAMKLYEKAQNIISQEFTAIADKNCFIKQLDLYKLNGFDNTARLASLKDLEIAMRLENVEEMPIHHTTWCKPGDEELILSYNKWDVFSTYQVLLITLGKTDNPLYAGKNKIELRQNLQKKFKINLLNTPDIRIGEQLMLKLYCDATNKNQYSVKKLRTIREKVYLKDCIPYWANIKSKEFNGFLNLIKDTSVKGEKKEFEYSVIFHEFKFDFGTGGAHGCIRPGIYQSSDTHIILDLDISSLYPSITKSLRFYPEHLGIEFVDLYSQFIDKRIAEKHKPKKERDNVLIEGYKLLLNGTLNNVKSL